MTQFEENFKMMYGRDFDPMYDFAGGWLFDLMAQSILTILDFLDPGAYAE